MSVDDQGKYASLETPKWRGERHRVFSNAGYESPSRNLIQLDLSGYDSDMI